MTEHIFEVQNVLLVAFTSYFNAEIREICFYTFLFQQELENVKE